MGAPALRCSRCSIDWPNTKEFFSLCAKCGEKTSVINNGDPLNSSEAVSLKNHLDFDRYCDERDAKLAEELKGLEGAYESAPSIPDPDEPDATTESA